MSDAAIARLSPDALAVKLAESVEIYDGLFAPLLVVGWDTGIRDGVLREVAARLPDVEIVRFSFLALGSQPLEAAIAARLAEVPPGRRTALALLDAESCLLPHCRQRGRADPAEQLNSLRDSLARRFAFPWILWLTDHGFRDLASRAPDFFDFRRHVFWVDEGEIPASPQAVQSMMRETGSPPPQGRPSQRIAPLGRLADALSDNPEPSPAEARALIGVLARLAEEYRAAGQSSQALAAAERGLAVARQYKVLTDIPLLTNVKSLALAALGRQREALETAQGAVALWTSLAQANPDAFRPDLAGSLNNLSNRLSELGRKQEAIEAIQQALGIYTDLAQANPDAFRPNLAASLNNLSNCLRELGRKQEAMEAIQQALGIYTDLAQANPDAFRPALIDALRNKARILRENGREDEAAAAEKDAVNLHEAIQDKSSGPEGQTGKGQAPVQPGDRPEKTRLEDGGALAGKRRTNILP